MTSEHLHIFDFDGTIARTNQLKTDGFAEVAKRYGEDAVTVRVDGGAEAIGPNADRDLAMDLTGDGLLDVRDVLTLLDAWGELEEPGQPGEPGEPGASDFNGDEVVDGLDLMLLLDELR